ncbi:(4Fe-4S)-binding protein [Dactylosporangium sp. NPDC051485]|uniref:ferredoxin n=1 Tax=Dactylosporangium sp. NPDC051485 TaxID=3154846 RepID=UPI003427072A
MTGAPRLVVNEDLCVGAGQCVLSHPELFDQDDTGQVVVFPGGPVGPEVAPVVADLCPSGALSLARD